MQCFDSLPNNKILDLSKFKAFADNNLPVAKIAKFVSDWVENIVGEGENAGNLEVFMVSLSFFHSIVRRQDCVVKG